MRALHHGFEGLGLCQVGRSVGSGLGPTEPSPPRRSVRPLALGGSNLHLGA